MKGVPIVDNMNNGRSLNELCDTIIWCMTVALMVSFSIFETNDMGKYVYLTLVLGIFALDVFKNRMKVSFRLNHYHLITMSFAIFVFLSSIWAIDRTYTMRRWSTTIETTLCMYIVYMHYQKAGTEDRLINVLKWSGYILALYSIAFYGFNNIRNAIALGDRVGNEFANINGIGMLASVSIVLTYSQIQAKKISFSMVFVIPAILMVVVSGSKKAFLELAGGVILLSMHRIVFLSKNPIKAVVKLVATVVMFVVAILIIAQLPFMKSVMGRMDTFLNLFTGSGSVDESTIRRVRFIQIGLEQFIKTPIGGIGIGNSPFIIGRDTYLHNNYIELLACGGLIGTLVFYVPYIWLMWKMITKTEKNETDFICLTLLILQLIMDFAQVSYFSKDTFFFMVLYSLNVQRRRPRMVIST